MKWTYMRCTLFIYLLFYDPLLSNVQKTGLFLVFLNYAMRLYNEVSTTKLLFLPSMFFGSLFAYSVQFVQTS